MSKDSDDSSVHEDALEVCRQLFVLSEFGLLLRRTPSSARLDGSNRRNVRLHLRRFELYGVVRKASQKGGYQNSKF